MSNPVNITCTDDSLDVLLTQYLSDTLDLTITDVIINTDTIVCIHDGNPCEIDILHEVNQATGECIEITLHSDDIQEIFELDIPKNTPETDSIFDAMNDINGVNSDMSHYLNNEDDDTEDRGESL